MSIASVFYSAVTGRDGTVDPGYLAMYWGMAVTVAMIPLVAIGAFFLAYWTPEHRSEILGSTAMLVAALGGQGAAIIGAVGLFRMGDKDRANVVNGSPTVPMAQTVAAVAKVAEPFEV